MKPTKLNKAICGLVMGGILLIGGIAFAADSTNAQPSMWGRHQSQGKEQGPRMMGTHIKDILSSLVTAGTITQAQADLITAALPQPPQNSLNQLVTNGTVTQDQLNAILQALHGNKQGDLKGDKRENPLTKLVSDGVITQAQADAIKAKFPKPSEKAADKSQAPVKFEDILASLVTDNTLTQEQSEAIAAAMPKHDGPFAQFVQEGTITAEQAKAIMDKFPKPGDNQQGTPVKYEDILSTLVSDGTLTQAQVDTMKASIQQEREKHSPANLLAPLVTAGTITQAQADAAVALLPTPGSQPAEKKAPLSLKDTLANLVTAGSITQAQADAILAKLPQRPANDNGQAGTKQGNAGGKSFGGFGGGFHGRGMR
ncbi:hypothetical protein H1S01_12740 [Heliobacterium chlorum]|uniref:Uncharacterized protein n=1 Tax=Heliobacterium chlorum TaxID=2698 RepID=A0ABR7T3M4_HELCL|nr:hypothetical protein [Heliobacterium chlorum]MBC9785375.1 hypothetical protein [Heliobacterium chlorum]